MDAQTFEGASGPPDPPAPRRPLTWRQDERGSCAATGPTGTGWRIDREPDGRYAITAGTWSRPDWWMPSLAAAKTLVDTFEARHDDPMPAVLGQSWPEVEAAHDALVAEAEERVTEWFWGPVFAGWERFEPLWSESSGERPKTRRRRAAPARISDGEQFGFDEHGRVVVARQFRWDGAVRRLSLRVAREAGDVRLEFETRPWGRRLKGTDVPTYDDAGRLVRLDGWGNGSGRDGFSWSGWAYGYAGPRVVRFWRSRRYAPDEGWIDRRIGEQLARLDLHRYELHVSYGDDGQVRTITMPEDRGEHVVYRRTVRGAAARAQRLLTETLPERIAAWAQRVAPADEVYCLAIQYAEHYNRPLPPALGLATVSELEAWRRQPGESLASLMWNPAEFALLDSEPAELLGDDALREAYDALNQEWVSVDDDRQPRRLLVAVAKALAGREWRGLRVGPHGLAVYAVDLELDDLERNLRASVPKETLRRMVG